MSSSKDFAQKDMGQITTYQSGVAQASAHRVVNRVVSDFLLSYDLTAMQWFIIGFIFDSGEAGMTLGDLTLKIGTTLPYTTNTINLLESKGIVSKKVHEKDSRVKLVTINKQHYEMVEEIETGLREELRRVLYGRDNISREDLSAYIRVLYQIINS